MMTVELPASEVVPLLAGDREPDIETLRTLLDPGRVGRVLAFSSGAQFAFLAINTTPAHPGMRAVQRSIVLLRGATRAVIAYDIVVPEDGNARTAWALTGPPEPFAIRRILAKGEGPVGETAFLHVLLRDASVLDISTLELAGIVVEGWAVLFHTETRSATSAVSFLVEGDQNLKVLVTGLAPGAWEIWRNGWLEEHPGMVTPATGSMFFAGRAGSYFLRRRG